MKSGQREEVQVLCDKGKQRVFLSPEVEPSERVQGEGMMAQQEGPRQGFDGRAAWPPGILLYVGGLSSTACGDILVSLQGAPALSGGEIAGVAGDLQGGGPEDWGGLEQDAEGARWSVEGLRCSAEGSGDCSVDGHGVVTGGTGAVGVTGPGGGEGKAECSKGRVL
ncbi:hypothetical protein C0989_009230 [Termitomyces sp. Mn162]|nr:hypothetical protein C0989_009230 [Termitomyces sp. Mn162]